MDFGLHTLTDAFGGETDNLVRAAVAPAKHLIEDAARAAEVVRSSVGRVWNDFVSGGRERTDWDVYSHERLRDMVKGPEADPAGVQGLGDQWVQRNRGLAMQTEVLEAAVNVLAQSWTGSAAGAMGGWSRERIRWMAEMTDWASDCSRAVADAAEALAVARSKMPDPPNRGNDALVAGAGMGAAAGAVLGPTGVALGAVAGISGSMFLRDREAAELKARAVHVMQEFDRALPTVPPRPGPPPEAGDWSGSGGTGAQGGSAGRGAVRAAVPRTSGSGRDPVRIPEQQPDPGRANPLPAWGGGSGTGSAAAAPAPALPETRGAAGPVPWAELTGRGSGLAGFAGVGGGFGADSPGARGAQRGGATGRGPVGARPGGQVRGGGFRGGAGSGTPPYPGVPGGGSARREEDTEHRNQLPQENQKLFTCDEQIPPPVIGG